jgi:hypothetical protein
MERERNIFFRYKRPAVRHTETVCDTIDTLGVGSRASSVI